MEHLLFPPAAFSRKLTSVEAADIKATTLGCPPRCIAFSEAMGCSSSFYKSHIYNVQMFTVWKMLRSPSAALPFSVCDSQVNVCICLVQTRC